MNYKAFYIILFFTTLSWSCDEPVPEVAEDLKVLEIEWTSRIDPVDDVFNSVNGVSYKDWYIYAGDDRDPVTLYAFNKDTGYKAWEIVLDQFGEHGINSMYLNDNAIIARSPFYVFSFDLETMEVLWSIDFRSINLSLGNGVLASNGKYYQKASQVVNSAGDRATLLYEIDPTSGNLSIIYTMIPDGEGTTGISPPVIYPDVQGNRSLLIANEYPNASVAPNDSKQYIIAIDLETKERVWETLVTTEFASNLRFPPVIYDGRIVITGGHNSIYGFDVFSGEKLWEYEDPNSLGFAQWSRTNHLIHGDRLFVNEHGSEVTCLDPETGAQIWNNTNAGQDCTDNMHYYEEDDLLLVTARGNRSVMVLDARNGQLIHKENNYQDSPYGSDPIYDEGKDLFFTTTRLHVVAFKVQRVL